MATNIKPTHLRQFDAFLSLPQTTQRTDAEVKDFCRQWVRNHPIYNVLGPNCQTFAEDLFSYLCGQNLPFSKSACRIDRCGPGPEHHPSTQWIRPEKKPN